MSKPLPKKQPDHRMRPSLLTRIEPSRRRTTNLKLVKPGTDFGWIQLQQMKGTDEFLGEVVDACASSVAVLDESGSLLFASQAWQLFEQTYKLNPHLRAQAPDVFAHCLRIDDSVLKKGERVITLRESIQQLLSNRRKEFQGTYSYPDFAKQLVVRAARLNLPSSGFRILITFEDAISPAEALKRTEDGLRVLLEKTRILPWEADFRTSRFTSVGAQAVSVLGYPIEDWYQPEFWATHVHPEDRDRVITESRRLLNAGDNYELEYRMIARDRREVWFHSLVTVIRENGKPRTLRGFSIDVTSSRQAEADLRDLSGRLIAAQEEERSRIARELHDGLNQRMALLSIELEQLRPDKEKPNSLRQRVRKLQSQVQEISADIHRLSYKLHPSKLDHLGLAAAIQSLCKELTDSGRLQVELEQKGRFSDIPKDVTLCVFRIAQEALRNCSRHSGAHAAQVFMEQTEGAVRLSVSDNGCGFDQRSDLVKKGLGFISMKERLRLVEGDLKIYSKPSRGTRIDVTVPLKRKEITRNHHLIERQIGAALSLS